MMGTTYGTPKTVNNEPIVITKSYRIMTYYYIVS